MTAVTIQVIEDTPPFNKAVSKYAVAFIMESSNLVLRRYQQGTEEGRHTRDCGFSFKCRNRDVDFYGTTWFHQDRHWLSNQANQTGFLCFIQHSIIRLLWGGSHLTSFVCGSVVKRWQSIPHLSSLLSVTYWQATAMAKEQFLRHGPPSSLKFLLLFHLSAFSSTISISS